MNMNNMVRLKNVNNVPRSNVLLLLSISELTIHFLFLPASEII